MIILISKDSINPDVKSKANLILFFEVYECLGYILKLYIY